MRMWALFLVILLDACATKLPLKTPIDTLFFSAGAGPSPTLIVLLPGIGDQPETFQAEGFVNAVRERHIDADIVAFLFIEDNVKLFTPRHQGALKRNRTVDCTDHTLELSFESKLYR